MVLNSNDTATSFFGTMDNGTSINGFDGEGVYNPDIDVGFSELVRSFHGLQEGHACTDNCHLVAVTLTDNLKTEPGQLITRNPRV